MNMCTLNISKNQLWVSGRADGDDEKLQTQGEEEEDDEEDEEDPFALRGQVQVVSVRLMIKRCVWPKHTTEYHNCNRTGQSAVMQIKLSNSRKEIESACFSLRSLCTRVKNMEIALTTGSGTGLTGHTHICHYELWPFLMQKQANGCWRLTSLTHFQLE